LALIQCFLHNSAGNILVCHETILCLKTQPTYPHIGYRRVDKNLWPHSWGMFICINVHKSCKIITHRYSYLSYYKTDLNLDSLHKTPSLVPRLCFHLSIYKTTNSPVEPPTIRIKINQEVNLHWIKWCLRKSWLNYIVRKWNNNRQKYVLAMKTVFKVKSSNQCTNQKLWFQSQVVTQDYW